METSASSSSIHTVPSPQSTINIHDSLMMSLKIDELAKAMSKIQGMIQMPKKTKDVSMTLKNGTKKEYSYSPLDEIYKSILDVAPKCGVAFSQDTVTRNNGLYIYTTIMHESGQFKTTIHECRLLDKEYNGQITKPSIQEEGSAITYTKRYAITGAFGIVADEDDDGEAINVSQNHRINSQIKPQQQGRPQMLIDPEKSNALQKQKEPIISKYASKEQVAEIYAIGRKKMFSDAEIFKIIKNVAGDVKSSHEIPTMAIGIIKSFLEKNEPGDLK